MWKAHSPLNIFEHHQTCVTIPYVRLHGTPPPSRQRGVRWGGFEWAWPKKWLRYHCTPTSAVVMQLWMNCRGQKGLECRVRVTTMTSLVSCDPGMKSSMAHIHSSCTSPSHLKPLHGNAGTWSRRVQQLPARTERRRSGLECRAFFLTFLCILTKQLTVSGQIQEASFWMPLPTPV